MSLITDCCHLGVTWYLSLPSSFAPVLGALAAQAASASILSDPAASNTPESQEMTVSTWAGRTEENGLHQAAAGSPVPCPDPSGAHGFLLSVPSRNIPKLAAAKQPSDLTQFWVFLLLALQLQADVQSLTISEA